MMDVLIQLVFVHEELNRYSRELVDKFLSLLLEHIFQAYIQWLDYIDNFSIYGVLQVGIELKFIYKIMKNYETPISINLFTVLDRKLNFLNLIEKGERNSEKISAAEKVAVKRMLENKLKASSILFECFREYQAE